MFLVYYSISKSGNLILVATEMIHYLEYRISVCNYYRILGPVHIFGDESAWTLTGNS